MGTTAELLKLIGQAGESDLDALDKEIKAASDGLESLKKLRSVIESKLGFKPEKKTRNSPGKQPLPETMEKRKSIARLLSREGALPPPTIASRCGIQPVERVYNLLKHEWFTATQEGYKLTDAGKKAIAA